jgi:hypothetical protein
MEHKFNLAETILGLAETFETLQREEGELRSQHAMTKQKMDEILKDICELTAQMKEQTLGAANPSPSVSSQGE